MTPSQATPLTSAAAVRLARLAFPGKWLIAGAGIASSSVHGLFCIYKLDDLALAEQRVVAAGLGYELADQIEKYTGIELDQQNPEGYSIWTVYATAEQRARALLALLDAHPELEKPQ